MAIIHSKDTSNQFRLSEYTSLVSNQTTRVDSHGVDLIASLYQEFNQNPNWKAQVANHVDATTNYSRVRIGPDFRVEPAFVWASNSQLKYTSKAAVRRFNSIDYQLKPTDTALRDVALLRLKKKLRNNAAIANVAVPLVELREFRRVITGIIEASHDVVNALYDIRRGKLSAARRHAEAAKVWLNYSFGIQPMISDSVKLAEALAEYQHGRNRFVRLVGKAEKKWLSSMNSYAGPAAYGADLWSCYSLEHHLSYSYTAGFDLEVKSANPYGILEQYSLKPEALPAIAWELTAFSWMFDYFTNIGDFLEDRFQGLPGETKYVSLNKKYTVKLVGRNYFKERDGFKITKSIPGNVVVSYSEFNRYKHPAQLGHIGLNFKINKDVTAFAVTKLLNLTSLLRSG